MRKKLGLNRERIRHLNAQSLTSIIGGFTNGSSDCWTRIPSCYQNECVVRGDH